ncbi:MAG TPA: hypothetical protein VMY42_22665 [Thermoguttaceae bacterium]|nr:hypothetical protein [Thermoguttaceae bacterium]
MIAPIRETQRVRRTPTLRRAHRLLVSTLLPKSSHAADKAPPIPRWQAWLFTLWVAAVSATYLAHMLRLF